MVCFYPLIFILLILLLSQTGTCCVLVLVLLWCTPATQHSHATFAAFWLCVVHSCTGREFNPGPGVMYWSPIHTLHMLPSLPLGCPPNYQYITANTSPFQTNTHSKYRLPGFFGPHRRPPPLGQTLKSRSVTFVDMSKLARRCTQRLHG